MTYLNSWRIHNLTPQPKCKNEATGKKTEKNILVTWQDLALKCYK